MYFKLNPDAAGDYIDKDGKRYSISVARRIRTAAGINVGYQAFEGIDEALTEWGVTALEMEDTTV